MNNCDSDFRQIARCFENIGKNHTISPEDKEAIILAIEELLLAQEPKAWVTEALADLVSSYPASCRPFIPSERVSAYLHRAADRGYVTAQYELGRKLRQGEFDEPNLSQSNYWMRMAANNGSIDAQYDLGMELIQSNDAAEYHEGAHWLQQLVLHECPEARDKSGDLCEIEDAQYLLAYQMELGRIEPLPEEKIFELYRSAGTAGVPEAMLATGHYLEHGIGVERDVKAAVLWYLKAAAQGFDEGYLLAGLVTENLSYLEKAAKAGHVAAMLILAPECLNQLSHMYPTGLEYFQKGIDYYEIASSKGNLEATLALASIFEDGWEGASYSFPDGWSELYSEADRLENALGYYQVAVGLGCDWAKMEILRIQKLLGTTKGINDDD